jgi:hypothetical protein
LEHNSTQNLGVIWKFFLGAAAGRVRDKSEDLRLARFQLVFAMQLQE